MTPSRETSRRARCASLSLERHVRSDESRGVLCRARGPYSPDASVSSSGGGGREKSLRDTIVWANSVKRTSGVISFARARFAGTVSVRQKDKMCDISDSPGLMNRKRSRVVGRRFGLQHPCRVPSAIGEPRLDAATPEEEGRSPPLVARYRAGVSRASGWTSARADRADARTARVVMFGSITSHTASGCDRASVPPGTARASPSGGYDAAVVHDADAPTSATREPASGETLLVRLPRPRPRPTDAPTTTTDRRRVRRDASRDRRRIRASGRRRDPRSAIRASSASSASSASRASSSSRSSAPDLA